MALPKSKSKHPLIEFWIPEIIRSSRFIPLRDNEVTCDVWREYLGFVEEHDIFSKASRHPMIQGNAECQLPTGERFAVFLYRMDTPSLSYEMLAEFCAATKRQLFLCDESGFASEDGICTPLDQCVVVERAMRREK